MEVESANEFKFQKDALTQRLKVSNKLHERERNHRDGNSLQELKRFSKFQVDSTSASRGQRSRNPAVKLASLFITLPPFSNLLVS